MAMHEHKAHKFIKNLRAINYINGGPNKKTKKQTKQQQQQKTKTKIKKGGA